jgi:hypothetical protein
MGGTICQPSPLVRLIPPVVTQPIVGDSTERLAAAHSSRTHAYRGMAVLRSIVNVRYLVISISEGELALKGRSSCPAATVPTCNLPAATRVAGVIS